MKQLTILRHAKSGWAEPGASDKGRKLSTRGHQQLLAISQWMQQASFSVDRVVCSSAVRTRETHAGIAAALDSPEVEFLDDLYLGEMEHYLDAIWAESNARSILIIGHNPTCDELTRYLAKPSSPAFDQMLTQHFGTGAMAIFDYDVGQWSELSARSCSLKHLLRPKQLEKAQRAK